MATDQTLAWAYTEDLYVESDVVTQARRLAGEFGISCVSPATGALLRLLVSSTGVASIVEVGTGAGVSGLYLLANGDVTLTSIDVEREAQHAAREAFSKAGVRSGRTRLINGRSADLLPRLAANSYDLVFLDGDPLETPEDAEEALRLLRPGGILVVARALAGGRVADPARREDDVVAIRNLGRELVSSPDLETSVVPVGEGLLVAHLL